MYQNLSSILSPCVPDTPSSNPKASLPHCHHGNWLPVLIGGDACSLVLESPLFCRKSKGLRPYAYVMMENHIHLVAEAPELSRCMQFFRQYTARGLRRLAETTGKEWQPACHLPKHRLAACAVLSVLLGPMDRKRKAGLMTDVPGRLSVLLSRSKRAWTDAHYDLIARHFEASSNLFHEQFPNSRFIVVFWGAGVTREPLLSRLSPKDIEIVDMGTFVKENIYEPKERAWSIEGDGHPLPWVYDAFARELVTQLKLTE